MNCITLAEAAYRPSQQVEEKVIIIAPHSLCIATMQSTGSELSKEQNRKLLFSNINITVLMWQHE